MPCLTNGAALHPSHAFRWKHRMRSKELVEVAGPRQNTLSSQRHEITWHRLGPVLNVDM